jgi:hypothetical protein
LQKTYNKAKKNFTSSYFYDHNNKENEEITNNVIDSIDEVPLNNFNQNENINNAIDSIDEVPLNNFEQNESPILLSDSSSNVIHHHHHHYHHHHHHHYHQNHNLENNSSLAQYDVINHDASDDDEKDFGDDDDEKDCGDDDDDEKDCEDDSDNNDDIDTYDEEEDDEDEDQEVYVIKNDVDETDSLTLEVSSAASSHSRCFICKNYVGRNSSPFKVISNDGIIDVYKWKVCLQTFLFICSSLRKIK